MRGLQPLPARAIAVIYAMSVALVVLVAITATFAFGEDLERSRHVPFPELPRTPEEVGSIALHNGRILLGAIGAALAVNAPWLTSAGQPVAPRGAWKAARALCDIVLVLGVARNLITVGIGFAAYRERMLLAILPHGLVELAAFACGLALYLSARRGPVERGVWLTLAGAGGLLLAIAAALEVLVVL